MMRETWFEVRLRDDFGNWNPVRHILSGLPVHHASEEEAVQDAKDCVRRTGRSAQILQIEREEMYVACLRFDDVAKESDGDGY
jgi:hypothetical protein